MSSGEIDVLEKLLDKIHVSHDHSPTAITLFEISLCLSSARVPAWAFSIKKPRTRSGW